VAEQCFALGSVLAQTRRTGQVMHRLVGETTAAGTDSLWVCTSEALDTAKYPSNAAWADSP